jgi:hypothetical protein
MAQVKTADIQEWARRSGTDERAASAAVGMDCCGWVGPGRTDDDLATEMVVGRCGGCCVAYPLRAPKGLS